jgi:hypothetical protein
MLLLTDTIWRELQGGYRIPYDASKTLVRMERGESVWEELWNELHHQGDVGVASYAAIPRSFAFPEPGATAIGISTPLRQLSKLSVIARTTRRCRSGLLLRTKLLGRTS